jgi:hypothetical protein
MPLLYLYLLTGQKKFSPGGKGTGGGGEERGRRRGGEGGRVRGQIIIQMLLTLTYYIL